MSWFHFAFFLQLLHILQLLHVRVAAKGRVAGVCVCVWANAKPINLYTGHIIDWRLPYPRPDIDMDMAMGHANGHMDKHITPGMGRACVGRGRAR